MGNVILFLNKKCHCGSVMTFKFHLRGNTTTSDPKIHASFYAMGFNTLIHVVLSVYKGQ